MDGTTREIESECARLLIAFSHGLDDGDADGVASLFAADGVWDRQGTKISGAEAIRAAVRERPAGTVTRHHFTNIRVRVIDADHAESRAYYAVYRHVGSGEPGPYPLAGPERVGDYVNRYRRTAEGWRITYNTARRLFARGA